MILPPMKLAPIHRPKVWGGVRLGGYPGRPAFANPIGESVEVSAIEAFCSLVAGGPFDGCSLADLAQEHRSLMLGKAPAVPFIVKILNVVAPLSIQVHPPDSGSEPAKDEGWVVLAADSTARVGLGFAKEASESEIREAIGAGTLPSFLKYLTPAVGDLIPIPAGCVHCAEGGLLLYEYQRPVDSTLRLYDFGRRRTGGGDPATAAAAALRGCRRKASVTPGFLGASDALVDDAGFRLRHILVDQGEKLIESGDRLHAVTALAGRLQLASGGGEVELDALQTAILPASSGDCRVSGEGAFLDLSEAPLGGLEKPS